MKTLLLAVLSLPYIVANAQSYKCPAEADGTHLSSAKIQIGKRHAGYALHGDVEQLRGGANINYTFPGGAPRWLVCQYGGKRIDGTAISGPQVIGARETWIQLDPLIDTCKLALRAPGPQAPSGRSWTAEASCKKREPPPPDMA